MSRSGFGIDKATLRALQDKAELARTIGAVVGPTLRNAIEAGAVASRAFLQFQDTVNALNNGGLSLVREMQRALDGARRWHDANEKVLRLLAPRGWLLSPLFPARLTFDLLELHATEGIDRVEEELLKALEPGMCEEMVESLVSREHFAPWLGTLRKALRAHQAGDYELAVPVWLIAIDGIGRAELG